MGVSFIQKIKEKLNPVIPVNIPTTVHLPADVKHEFCNFESAYRIGLLSVHTEYDSVAEYKKKLENLGYECDVLIFIDSQENIPAYVLPTYSYEDLDKRTLLPHSPRTDRFILKRFDMLINLYFKPSPQLVHISNMSWAKCRIGPYVDVIKDYVDLMVPIDQVNNVDDLIETMNIILKLKPYERKLA